MASEGVSKKTAWLVPRPTPLTESFLYSWTEKETPPYNRPSEKWRLRVPARSDHRALSSFSSPIRWNWFLNTLNWLKRWARMEPASRQHKSCLVLILTSFLSTHPVPGEMETAGYSHLGEVWLGLCGRKPTVDEGPLRCSCTPVHRAATNQQAGSRPAHALVPTMLDRP